VGGIQFRGALRPGIITFEVVEGVDEAIFVILACSGSATDAVNIDVLAIDMKEHTIGLRINFLHAFTKAGC
jgi:hypothetical protein